MAADDEPASKRPTDPLKAYIVVFAVLSLFIGYLYVRMSGEESAYAKANAEAPRLLGDRVADAGDDQRPTSLYALGTDILKYAETYKGSQIKPEEGGGIPNRLIRDRIDKSGIGVKGDTGIQTQKVSAKGYEETSITYDMEPASIKTFAELLYSIEGQSASLRIIELSWTLRQGKENPYPPGDAIQSEKFKVGTRKPIVER